MTLRTVLLIPFLSMAFLSTAQKQNNVFELKGNVKNGNGKKIYFQYNSNKKIVTDSTIIKNNQFVIKGKINCPTAISFGEDASVSTGVAVYLEPKKQTASFEYPDFKNFKLTGSKTNDETVLMFKKLSASGIYKQMDSINKIFAKYREQLNTKNELVKKEIETKWNDLDRFSDQLQLKLAEMRLDFAKENPHSFVSLGLLKFPLQRRQKSYEEVLAIYNSLSDEVRNSDPGFEFHQYLENYSKSIIGSTAPDFSGKDINGNPITLNGFKNKYVLLDFWASWCGPCRADMPELKQLYRQYHNKGFEIINISRDENLDAWKKAIEKDEIGIWNHISIVENKSSVEKEYTVTAIPVKILIDKNGVIVGRWLGSGDDNINELKQKIKEVIGDI